MDVNARVRRQPGFDLRLLVGGIVVRDQMQLLVGVAAGEVWRKTRKLLVPVPRLCTGR